MVKAFKSGQMGPYTKGTGEITRPTVTVNSLISMVTCTKANGSMTKRMGMVSISMSMALVMRGIGKMTCSMAKAKRAGPTIQCLKVNILAVRSMALESTSGMMRQNTMDSGWKTKSTA